MAAKNLIVSLMLLLFGICVFRALFLFQSANPPEPCRDKASHKALVLNKEAQKRFQDALNIPTISYKAHIYESTQLNRFIDYIQASFPRIHNTGFISREIVANHTLLYSINGSNQKLSPYLLTSHMDVVPAVREKWSTDPFKSILKDDQHIYARGTIDAKHLLVAILESFETMLSRGFKPKRSFYLVFGHDEEVGGVEGASTISQILPSRLRQNNWDKLHYILDEGGVISKTPVPGIDAPIALVGVAEKGYVTVNISTVGVVGHGSMPPPQTAISKLSKAISKFHSNLFPSMFGKGVEREMLETFARHSRWPHKLAYSNLWLFNPIFEYVFSNDPTLNSLIRTSTAVTMITGGTKENVLPDSASALVNHRIHQLQTIEDVLKFDRSVINDPTIQVQIHGHHNEPTPTSPSNDDSLGFQLIRKSVLEIYPEAVVVPSVFLASTDSKWYSNLTDAIYKFSAIAVPLEEMKRFHGHDERISVKNYENLINFYHHLISNSDRENLNSKNGYRDEL